MPSFRDLPFQARFAKMGDESEQMFEQVNPFGRFQRLGWNRPAVSMAAMSSKLKAMPDYYTAGYLVECMGLGRDGILKLKVVKYDALKWWTTSGNEVMLFAWNSSTHEYAFIEWSELKGLVRKARAAGIEAFSNDGNEYYGIQWSWVEGRVKVGRGNSA